MIEWLKQNKEWLFSGGGITLLTLAYFVTRYLFSKRVEIKVNELAKSPSILLTKNDAAWNEWSSQIIKTARPKTAYFIEYSGANVHQIINFALDSGWIVKLLLKNPDSIDATWQREKIKTSFQFLIRDLRNEIEDSRFQIFYYDKPGSIRMRYFEDTAVTLGWYTYDFRENFGENQIFGHNNPTFSITHDMKEWEQVKNFAHHTFLGMIKEATKKC